MPSSVTAKTVLAPKYRELIFILVALLFGVTATAWYQHSQLATMSLTMTDRSTYELEVADTVKTQSKGLSGRKSMPRNEGMLFVFPREGKQCFWMKDMHFSLDMIWLNEHQKVVSIDRNVSPGTYPQQFCGDASTMYVIELNAGQASKEGIVRGDTLNF